MYKNQKGFSVGQVLLVILVLGLIGGVGYFVYQQQNKQIITSFEECVAAGNPVMESYPEQCNANGEVFRNDSQVDASDSGEMSPESEIASKRAAMIENIDITTPTLREALIDTYYAKVQPPCLDVNAKYYISVQKVVRNDFAQIQYCTSGASTILGNVDGEWKVVGGMGFGAPGCVDAMKYKISKEIADTCINQDGTSTRTNYE